MTEERSAIPAATRLPDYGKADRLEILGTEDDPFGVASAGLVWRSKDVHFGVRHGGRLVAHAGLPSSITARAATSSAAEK